MKKLGLIGKTLSHSFSKKYFEDKFKKEDLGDCIYNNYELESIDDFPELLKREPDLIGLNVTIPFKRKIIDFLDETDEVSRKIGAVNTVHIQKNGQLKGYNTDVIGFRNSIKPFLDTNHTRALIFGTGGASAAIAYVLDQLQIPYYFVSRSPESSVEISYNDLDKSAIASFKFLINCTPQGTYPNINEMVCIDTSGIGSKHLVYDLVYNPKESRLLKEAKQQGAITVNGLSMLKLQAEESWNIWRER